MKRLNKITSLIVLALWVSCMVRCTAAALTGSSSLVCCGETSDDCDGPPGSASHCVCDLGKSGVFVSEQKIAARPLTSGITIFAPPTSLETTPMQVRAVDLIFSPPEILAGWQFIYQTAAPPRAPSFVS
jgi:hypothetical protein